MTPLVATSGWRIPTGALCLLAVGVALVIISALIPDAKLASQLAAASIALALVFRTPHLVMTWWMAYLNTPVKQAYGEKEYRKIFWWRGGLVFLGSFTFFAAASLLPAPWNLIVFLLLTTTGPLPIMHILTQDRGVLSLIGTAEPAQRQFNDRLKKYLLTAILFGELYFLNRVLITKVYDVGNLSFLRVVDLTVTISLLGFALAFVIISFRQMRAFKLRHLYCGLYSGSYLGRLASQFNFTSAGALFTESFRHNLIYILLVRTFFRNRTVASENSRLENLMIQHSAFFWISTITFSAFLAVFSWQIFFILPLMPSGMELSSLSPLFYALSFGIAGATIFHHFYVERYLWRFRNKGLRDRMLPILHSQPALRAATSSRTSG